MHPYTYPFATTCPMFFSTVRQNGKTFVKENTFKEHVTVDGKYEVEIGNDVWINAKVSIVAGVKVGDGAVLLSGTVVTKDVPPYAIVGGVPAKVLRYRYSQEDIAYLLKLLWWNKPVEWLEENAYLLNNIDALREKIPIS